MSVIRVLVVDDSAFARKVLREVLEDSEDLRVVGTARDGLDALEKIVELSPDVVTLDLVMPALDGVGVLRELASRPSSPRVVIVTMTDQDSALGVAALQAGAFDVVQKPTAIATDRLYALGDELRAKVRAAGGAPPTSARAVGLSVPLAPAPRRAAATATDLVVIGASTGGPQAISRLLAAFPKTFPVPVAIVLHMPPGYTAALAARLDSDCALEVVEAKEGLVLRPGLVVIARAGMHLKLARDGTAVRAKLDVFPTESLHRPSVDVLFLSAAEVSGPRVLGVVLTGMGSDGVVGARAIRARGGRVVTESESSCVVYGMPRAVVEAELSTGQAPIERMAALIAESL